MELKNILLTSILLTCTLISFFFLQDVLINRVVLPHLCHIETDHDPQVRKVAADMLLVLASGCTPACFVEIMAVIEKVTS